MKKKMIIVSCVFLLITIVFTIWYRSSDSNFCLSMAITFGTISYHFIMRLIVGYLYNAVFQNKIDYKSRWFNERTWEKNLYKKLNVKKWKAKMPTFEPEFFDLSKHSWNEVVGAMCQAELVHETIVVLSFLPIVAGLRFGAFPVFVITSVFAAMIDLAFVIMQRYNRPRVIQIMKKKGDKT